MGRTLTPFTRLTLMVTEMNSNRVEDLADPARCDLVHHFAALETEFSDENHKEQARLIGEQGRLLIASIERGDFAQAEKDREKLVATCKALKDIV